MTAAAEAVRQVPAATFWRAVHTSLARLACEYADPTYEGHDHPAECLVDDVAYSAQLLLWLAAACTRGDEDALLDRVMQVAAAVQPLGRDATP